MYKCRLKVYQETVVSIVRLLGGEWDHSMCWNYYCCCYCYFLVGPYSGWLHSIRHLTTVCLFVLPSLGTSFVQKVLPDWGKMRRGWRWPSTGHKPLVRPWIPRPPLLVARIYIWPPPWTSSAHSSVLSRPFSCRTGYLLPARRRRCPPYWRNEHVSFWFRWMKTCL